MTAFNIEYAISAKDALTPVLRRAQAQLKSMERSLSAFKGSFKLNVDTKQAQSQVAKLQKSISSLNQSVNVGVNAPVSQPSGGGVGGFASAGTNGMSAGLFTRMGAGGAVAAAGFAVAGLAAKEAIGGAIDLETAQLGLRKAFDMTTEQIQPYTKELRSLSSSLGIAQENVTELATQYAKADSSLNPAQLKEITQLTIASSKAWKTSTESTQNSFFLLKEIYKQTTAELAQTAGGIDKLGDEFGILSEEYLNQFIFQSGATAKAAGLSADGMLAFASASGQAMAEAGQAGGVLKWLTAGMADKGNKTVIEKLGVDFAALQNMNPDEKIRAILNATKAYQGTDKLELLKDIVGGNYNDELNKIAEQAGDYTKALEKLSDKAGNAGRVQKALGLESETTQGKIDRARETVRNFFIELGDNGRKAIGYFIDKAFELGAWFLGSSKSAEIFKVALVGIISVINPFVGLGIILYNVYQNSSALRGAFENLGQAFSPIVDLFGDGGEAGDTLSLVLKGIGAGLAVIVDVVATAIDGLTTLFKMAGNVADMDWGGIVDNAKGFMSRTAARREKTFTNIRNDFATPSPTQAQAAAAARARSQAGLAAAGGGAMQTAANTQVQAAGTSAAAAAVTQSASTLDSAAATVNAQSALTQQQAATTQASVGNQFMSAAQQMMAAAQTMMAATSRPLTVNVSGGAGMGDQGR